MTHKPGNHTYKHANAEPCQIMLTGMLPLAVLHSLKQSVKCKRYKI